MLFESIRSILNVARALADVLSEHIGHPGGVDYSLNKINVRTGMYVLVGTCVCVYLCVLDWGKGGLGSRCPSQIIQALICYLLDALC